MMPWESVEQPVSSIRSRVVLMISPVILGAAGSHVVQIYFATSSVSRNGMLGEFEEHASKKALKICSGPC